MTALPPPSGKPIVWCPIADLIEKKTHPTQLTNISAMPLGKDLGDTSLLVNPDPLVELKRIRPNRRKYLKY